MGRAVLWASIYEAGHFVTNTNYVSHICCGMNVVSIILTKFSFVSNGVVVENI